MADKSVDSLLKAKKIKDIINPRLVQASPDISVTQAIQIMQENKSGYIVLAKGKKVIGIVTETDVIRKVLEQNIDWKQPISNFMTKDPAVLTPEDSVASAIDMMGIRRFYHIPLVNEKGELVNVISVRTLIRFLAEFYPNEILNLPPVPNQIMDSAEGG